MVKCKIFEAEEDYDAMRLFDEFMERNQIRRDDIIEMQYNRVEMSSFECPRHAVFLVYDDTPQAVKDAYKDVELLVDSAKKEEQYGY